MRLDQAAYFRKRALDFTAYRGIHHGVRKIYPGDFPVGLGNTNPRFRLGPFRGGSVEIFFGY